MLITVLSLNLALLIAQNRTPAEVKATLYQILGKAMLFSSLENAFQYRLKTRASCVMVIHVPIEHRTSTSVLGYA